MALTDDEFTGGVMDDPPSPTLIKRRDSIDTYLKPLAVDGEKLHRLSRRFATTFRHLALSSSEQFLPTPISSLPSGKERGRFLAIDVGGTNLRVGFIELLGDSIENAQNGSPESKSEKSRDAKLPAISDTEKDPIGRTPRKHPRLVPEINDDVKWKVENLKPRIRRTLEKAWPIGEHLKKDQAEDLFAWIGDCMAEVVKDYLERTGYSDSETAPDEIDMGITFSFPMIQNSLAEATLMPMGKGFAITSNLNLGKLLLAGYERHTKGPETNGKATEDSEKPSSKRRRVDPTVKLPRLRIAAITNDTVATLASLAYTVKSRPNSRVAMGIIVGTGSNATIPMKLSTLHPDKRKQVSLPPGSIEKDIEIVINSEWTISGTAPPMRELGFFTKWDDQLDAESNAPGFQPLEYMTAGRYLGELTRIILLDVFKTKLEFHEDDLPKPLCTKNAVTTFFLATVVAKVKSGAQLVHHLEHFLPSPEGSEWHWTEETAEVFRKIARLVQVRSAGLIAAATIGLLGSTGEVHLDQDEDDSTPPINGALKNTPNDDLLEELVVAYTGGTITHYPAFLETCQNCIHELLRREGLRNMNKRVVLREARDGGIIGAGVLAGTVATT